MRSAQSSEEYFNHLALVQMHLRKEGNRPHTVVDDGDIGQTPRQDHPGTGPASRVCDSQGAQKAVVLNLKALCLDIVL